MRRDEFKRRALALIREQSRDPAFDIADWIPEIPRLLGALSAGDEPTDDATDECIAWFRDHLSERGLSPEVAAERQAAEVMWSRASKSLRKQELLAVVAPALGGDYDDPAYQRSLLWRWARDAGPDGQRWAPWLPPPSLEQGRNLLAWALSGRLDAARLPLQPDSPPREAFWSYLLLRVLQAAGLSDPPEELIPPASLYGVYACAGWQDTLLEWPEPEALFLFVFDAWRAAPLQSGRGALADRRPAPEVRARLIRHARAAGALPLPQDDPWWDRPRDATASYLLACEWIVCFDRDIDEALIELRQPSKYTDAVRRFGWPLIGLREPSAEGRWLGALWPSLVRQKLVDERLYRDVLDTIPHSARMRLFRASQGEIELADLISEGA